MQTTVSGWKISDIMSPNLWGGGHIDFGADPVDITKTCLFKNIENFITKKKKKKNQIKILIFFLFFLKT